MEPTVCRGTSLCRCRRAYDTLLLDNTCMQPGYWEAITDFLLDEGFISRP